MNQKQMPDKLMNSKFMIITFVMVISIITLSQFHSANAELRQGNSYILYVKGHDITNNLEHTIELQLSVGSGSSSKLPISVVEGLIIHDNKDFVTSKNWKGTIFRNDKLLVLSGDAISYDGTMLKMELLGKLVDNTTRGAMYRLVGIIIHDNQRVIIFAENIEIMNINHLTNEIILNEMPHIIINQSNVLKKLEAPIIKKSAPITVITKHTDRLYIEYPYIFTSKVYLLKENPHDYFDLKGGEVQGAHVTVEIVDNNGKVVKSFNGTTDRFGYFSDSFLPPDNFALGTYMVHVTAEKDGSSDTDDLVLHIFQPAILLGGSAQTNVVETNATSDISVSITSPTDGSTINNSSFTISGTASGTDLASVAVQVDGTHVIVTGTTNWSAPSGTLSDGIHTIIATASDNMGHTASKTIHVTTDITSPTATITSPSSGAYVYTSATTISGTAFDSISGIQKVEVKVDSNTFQTATGTTSWTFNTGSLSDGSHTMQVRATDNVGNIFTGTQTTFNVDTKTPTGLTATAASRSSINLSWTAPNPPVGTITGYKIERESPIGGGWNIIDANTGNTQRTHTDNGLTSNTQYNYRVSAIYSDHTSMPSNTASATTPRR